MKSYRCRGQGRSCSSCNLDAEGESLTVAVLEQCLRDKGHAPNATFHGRPPFIGYVETRDKHSPGGRFFPSRNAILVYICHRDDVTIATENHETAHAIQYAERCGGTTTNHRRKCGYVGQHDARFYATLEELHRKRGVSPEAAREVEGDHPDYPYPKHWDRETWR